jgi:hypothetical protein
MLRALVQEGLQKIIAKKTRRPALHLRYASFGGRGLRPELRDVGWELRARSTRRWVIGFLKLTKFDPHDLQWSDVIRHPSLSPAFALGIVPGDGTAFVGAARGKGMRLPVVILTHRELLLAVLDDAAFARREVRDAGNTGG